MPGWMRMSAAAGWMFGAKGAAKGEETVEPLQGISPMTPLSFSFAISRR